MKTIKLVYQIKQPCPKCPYTLGLIHMVKNPCPECKEKDYQLFERFKTRASGGYVDLQDDVKRMD